ncbi:hypothetical protein D3C80_1245200 [compost metagenome]
MMANGGNDILPRADIDALKRFVQQKQTAGFGLPPADDDLLLVAARKRPDGGVR